MTPDMQNMKSERVRALVQKLGFKNSLLVLQPEDGHSFSVIVDTDSPERFASATVEAVFSFYETVIERGDDPSKD